MNTSLLETSKYRSALEIKSRFIDSGVMEIVEKMFDCPERIYVPGPLLNNSHAEIGG